MWLMKYKFLLLQSWNLTCLVIIQPVYGIEGATAMETGEEGNEKQTAGVHD